MSRRNRARGAGSLPISTFSGTIPYPSARSAYNAAKLRRGRVPAAERALLKHDVTGEWMVRYVRDIVQTRVPKFESRMAELSTIDPATIYWYAVIARVRGRFMRQLEQRLAEDERCISDYCKYVVRRRVVELEQQGFGEEVKV